MYKYQQTTQTKSSTVSKIDIWAFNDQITDRSYTRCHYDIAVYRRSRSNHKQSFDTFRKSFLNQQEFVQFLQRGS